MSGGNRRLKKIASIAIHFGVKVDYVYRDMVKTKSGLALVQGFG